MEIEIVRQHIHEMLEVRGDDVSYIDEHGDLVDPMRYYSEIIELSTDKTTVFFTLSKELLRDWRNRETDPEAMIRNYKTKNFILILMENPSPAINTFLSERDKALQALGGMLQWFLIKDMMYNPTKHVLVPLHEKMSEADAKEIMASYMIKHKSQLPAISRTDKIARWLGLRHGDIVRITRYSDTAGMSYYYRCCI